jgi:Peptidase S24-like
MKATHAHTTIATPNSIRFVPYDVGWNLALDEGSVINPLANYAVVKVVGDAMSPTYPAGSLVLFDADIRAPSPPGVFVLRDGDGYTLQRCQIVLCSKPLMVRLLPDNPSHKCETVPVSTLDVAGMVDCGISISGDADEMLAYLDWEIATEPTAAV